MCISKIFSSVTENKGCLIEVSYFKLLSNICHRLSKDIGVIPLTRYGFLSGDGLLDFPLVVLHTKLVTSFFPLVVCAQR